MNDQLSRRRFLTGITASTIALLTGSSVTAKQYRREPGNAWGRSSWGRLDNSIAEPQGIYTQGSHEHTVERPVEQDTTELESNPDINSDEPKHQHLEASQVNLASAKDVRAFGALGDGVNDDTHALVSAFESAGSDGIVYLPAGTYRTTRTVSVPGSLKVVGDGRDLSRIHYTGDGRIFHIVDQSDISFEALEIIGNPTPPYWGYGIHIERSDSIVLRNCRIRDIYEHAVYLHIVNEVLVEDTEFRDIGLTGVRLSPTGEIASNSHVTVRNCQFHSIVTRALDGNSAIHAHGNFGTPTNNEHLVIEGCYVDSHRIGIGLDDVTHATVRDCRITGHLKFGEGIALSGSDVLIEHNQINNFIAAGVLVWGINWKPNSNNTVQSNEIWDCAQGIAISTWFPGSEFDGIRIQGNRCYRVYGTGTNGWGDMAYGIQAYIDTNPLTGQRTTNFSVRGIDVVGNDLRGNKAGPYSFVEPYTSATRFVDNLG